MEQKDSDFYIRAAREEETSDLGRLLVKAYAGLDGFPKPVEQPEYYQMLANVGHFAGRPGVKVLVAKTSNQTVAGGVVYFGDMEEYGGKASSMTRTSGIRLLGVDPRYRGRRVGKALTDTCIQLARHSGHSGVVLHTTHAMTTAWTMYRALGFERIGELDFRQGGLDVFGFLLRL